MTNVHRAIGSLEGKDYFKTDLLNKCGWLKHTLPAVYIFKIHDIDITDTVQTKSRLKQHIIYIRITQSGCNNDRVAKSQTDKLSIVSKQGAIVHTIIFKAFRIWEGDLHTAVFGLVVEKRSACTALDVSYRSEMVVIQTDYRYIKFNGRRIFLLEVSRKLLMHGWSAGRVSVWVWYLCGWCVCVWVGWGVCVSGVPVGVSWHVGTIITIREVDGRLHY